VNNCQRNPSVVCLSVCPFLKCLKDFFSRTARPISTKLGRKLTWRMGIQLCSNERDDPYWGPIRCKIRKLLINLQKSSSHEPQAGMHWYLVWSILGEKRLVKSLGPCMAPSQGLKLLHSDI